MGSVHRSYLLSEGEIAGDHGEGAEASRRRQGRRGGVREAPLVATGAPSGPPVISASQALLTLTRGRSERAPSLSFAPHPTPQAPALCHAPRDFHPTCAVQTT